MRRPLSGPYYYGGKSVNGKSGTGRWITELLPYRTRYIEPFSGMLGVLLQRRPSPVEIVNDLDGHVVNWWLAVRDDPERLAQHLELTPHSRKHYELAHRTMAATAGKEPDGNVERATAIWTVLLGAAVGGSARAASFGLNFKHHPHTGSWRDGSRVFRLAQRLRKVQLDSRPAETILNRVSEYEDAVVYCDPPYRTADCRAYKDNGQTLDVEAISEALIAQRGAVAISGYGEEWNHLGWNRLELQAQCSSFGEHGKRKDTRRTEVLWLNFDPGPIQRKLAF